MTKNSLILEMFWNPVSLLWFGPRVVVTQCWPTQNVNWHAKQKIKTFSAWMRWGISNFLGPSNSYHFNFPLREWKTEQNFRKLFFFCGEMNIIDILRLFLYFNQTVNWHRNHQVFVCEKGAQVLNSCLNSCRNGWWSQLVPPTNSQPWVCVSLLMIHSMHLVETSVETSTHQECSMFAQKNGYRQSKVIYLEARLPHIAKRSHCCHIICDLSNNYICKMSVISSSQQQNVTSKSEFLFLILSVGKLMSVRRTLISLYFILIPNKSQYWDRILRKTTISIKSLPFQIGLWWKSYLQENKGQVRGLSRGVQEALLRLRCVAECFFFFFLNVTPDTMTLVRVDRG